MSGAGKYTLHIFAFVALIVVIGTLGYFFIEDGWTLQEAFYMTVITISTVGFGEIHELSDAGRLFTVVLIFTGFGAIGLLATQIARIVIGTELRDIFVHKQIQKIIMKLKDHYIVCGYGEIGTSLCGELIRHHVPFVVIEKNPELVSRAEKDGYPMVQGNATSDESLREAGIERAAGLITVLSDDADNLFISLAARELNPRLLIIARVEDSEVEGRVLRAGADVVVSPLKLGGRQIAQFVMDEATLSSAQAEGTEPEVLGLHLRVYRPPAGEAVTPVQVLEKTGALQVVAVRQGTGDLVQQPSPSFKMTSQDSVILLARKQSEAPQRPLHEATGKRILLADDHRALRLLFARKIGAAGHEVVQAGSGEEALQLAKQHVPDLIILDVLMPGMTGYETCKLIKQEEPLRNIPVVLYSADTTEEFARLGRECGAHSCIRKSSRSSELLSKLEEILGSSGTGSPVSKSKSS